MTCIRWTSSDHLGAGRGHTPTNTGTEGGGLGKMTFQKTEKITINTVTKHETKIIIAAILVINKKALL